MGSRTITTCDRCGENVPDTLQAARPMLLLTLRPESELDEAIDRSELKDLCVDCEKVVADMLRHIFAVPRPKTVSNHYVPFTKLSEAPPAGILQERGGEAVRVVLTVFGPGEGTWSQAWAGAAGWADGNRVILCPNADDTDGAMAIVWGPWVAFKERRGTVGKVDIDWGGVAPFVPPGRRSGWPEGAETCDVCNGGGTCGSDDCLNCDGDGYTGGEEKAIIERLGLVEHGGIWTWPDAPEVAAVHEDAGDPGWWRGLTRGGQEVLRFGRLELLRRLEELEPKKRDLSDPHRPPLPPPGTGSGVPKSGYPEGAEECTKCGGAGMGFDASGDWNDCEPCDGDGYTGGELKLIAQLGLEQVPENDWVWWPSPVAVARPAVFQPPGSSVWTAWSERGRFVSETPSRLKALESLAEHVADQETDGADDARWVQEEGEVQGE